MNDENPREPLQSRADDSLPPHKLRVAFLIWRLHPRGGIPRFQASLLRSVADRPWLDLHVISVRPNYADDELEQYANLATFHFLDLDGESSVPKRLRALLQLAAVLRILRPDVLHVHGGIGWLPALLTGPSAVVLQVHDPPQVGRDSALTTWVERWASRLRGWQLVVDASGVAEQLAEAWNLNETAIRVEPLGIDTHYYEPSAHRATASAGAALTSERLEVAWLGRLVPSKQPELFVELASRVVDDLPHAVFRLAGEGSMAAELARINEAAGGGCELTGRVPEVREFLRSADVFVSTSAAEGFGLAVLEAMAMGVPVVALDAAGLRDLIVDGTTGYLVSEGDLAALADRLIHLAQHAQLLNAMGSAAAERASRTFSLEAMGNRYVRLWTDVAPSHRGRSRSIGCLSALPKRRQKVH